MSPSHDRDVFVSYRHGDPTKTWLRKELVPALEADGLSVVVDHRDFQAGESLLEQMEAAVSRTRVTVAVVDHRYRASDYTTFEWTISSRLVVVVRGDVDNEQIPPHAGLVELGDSDDVEPVVTEVNRVLKRVFVLGAKDDERWVDGVLVPELRRAGVSAQRSSDLEGKTAITAFEQAMQRADKVVIVLSGAYYHDLADENTVVARARVVVEHVVIQDKLVPIRRDPSEFEIEPRYTRKLIIDATNDERWDDAIAAVCRLLDVEAPTPLEIPDCPYPGMQKHDVQHGDVFFGRGDSVIDLRERLRSFRFATVIGPSGSGKSSLVYAGVLPNITTAKWGDDRYDVYEAMRPGRNPITKLEEVLQSLAQRAGADGAENVDRLVRRLLVIDQLEEIFAPAIEVRKTAAFLAELERVITTDESLSVIVTVRADFTDNLMESSMWQPVFAPSRVEVTPLAGDNLREAIIEPAAKRGVAVSQALVERLVAETSGEPGLLPFLQVSLRRTWAEMRVHYMTIDAYERAGAEHGRSGVRQAIAQQAADALQQVKVELGDDHGELVVRRLLLRLIHFGSGGRTTRSQATRAELAHIADDEGAVATALDVLDRYRIVTIDDRAVSGGDSGAAVSGVGERADSVGRGGGASREAVVDLSHEAIIEGWPKLAGWIERYSVLEIGGRQWAEREEQYRTGNGSLLAGRDLDRAEDWVSQATTSFLVDAVVRDFVSASRADVDARSAARRRTRRRLRVVGGVLVAAVLIFAVGASILWQRSESARDRAEREADRRVATQLRTSASAYSGGLALQALLVRAADVIDPTELSAIEMLTTVEQDPPISVRIDATEKGVGFDAGLMLDDGRFVIGDGLGDFTVRPGTVDGDDGDNEIDNAVNVGHTILALEPLAGTAVIAVGGGNATPLGNNRFRNSDGGIDLIDISQEPFGRTPIPLTSEEPISSLVHRDDLLIAGSWGGEVLAIDVSNPGRPKNPRSLEFPPTAPTPGCPTDEVDRSVRALAVDDGGRWLVAALTTCQLAVWEWPSLTPLISVGGHTDQIRAIDFVPASSELLSTGNDRSIRSVDLTDPVTSDRALVASAGGRTSATGVVGEGRVTALCVAPDGSAVMTAGRDHLVRRWLRVDGKLRPDQTQYASHATTVRSLRCLADDRVLSTAGDSVVLWDLSKQVRSGSSVAGLTDVRDVAVRTGRSSEAAVVDDGLLVLVGRPEEVVLPQEVRELSINLVDYSPDGSLLAVAGERPGGFADRLVVVNATSLSVESVVDSTGDGRLWSIAVGDDGRVVAGMNEGELLIGERSVLTVPTGRRVTAVAVSADGHLVIGDIGGTLMCGVADGPPLRQLPLGRAINDVDLDQASGTIVVGTAAGLVQVYPGAVEGVDPAECDPATWRQTSPPVDHDVITSIDSANGGEILVATNSDGYVEIWDVPRLRLIGRLTLPNGNQAEFAAIDPRARFLLVGGDAAAISFDVDREQLRRRLCGVARRDLTPDEEEAFLPEARYQDFTRCVG